MLPLQRSNSRKPRPGSLYRRSRHLRRLDAPRRARLLHFYSCFCTGALGKRFTAQLTLYLHGAGTVTERRQEAGLRVAGTQRPQDRGAARTHPPAGAPSVCAGCLQAPAASPEPAPESTSPFLRARRVASVLVEAWVLPSPTGSRPPPPAGDGAAHPPPS